MQVSVESPSALLRRLTVVVPAEKINTAYDKRVSDMAKRVKIDGFRPGKAPITIVKQRYGQTLHQEALSDVIQSSLNEAIFQEKLSPVGVPTVEPKNVQLNQPLEFVATFEVLPVIEKVKFELASLDKETAIIEVADIEKVLTHLREQHANWKQVNRPAQEKDQAIIDFSGKIDGVEFKGGQAHDYPIGLGSKTMLPGFEEGILGMVPGEEKVIKITFPDNYFAKEVAGKEAEFAIKLIKLSEPELPELDDAFANKLGIKGGNIESLQAEIKKNLERELARVIKAQLKKQVFDKFLEQNPIEIPKALIEREASRIHDELHPHHKGHQHDHSPEEMAQFNEAATRNVALGLLMAEFIKEHQIKADKEAVDAYVADLATVYENPAEVVAWYKNNKQAYNEAEMQVLEGLVLDKLLESTTVNEKTLSYSDLISR